VANAAPQDRNEVVVLPPGSTGDLVPAQKTGDGQVVAWATVVGSGIGSLESVLPSGVAPVTAEGTVLDNGLLRVDVDADGLLSSVRDLVADREVITPGSRGNLLQLHPDHPNEWDAWDIDRHYLRQRVDLVDADSVTLTESGPLIARVEVRRSFGASRVTQIYTLAAGSRRLDIDTEVDWHESEKVLKAAFDLDVQADRSASEIQFGHVHRPTHTNTSWDQARFEICAHRWVQVGETGYGVAIANDSTYGHDVRRASSAEGRPSTVVRLTLLRAPHSPDPHTDQGEHRFSYSVVPGAGVREAADAGYSLNLPLRPFQGTAATEPVVRVDHPAVRVESVKLAEDRSGDVVVRLYEAEGGRADAGVWPGFECAAARIVDLLERPLEEVELHSGRVQLSLRPFEIVTLRLVPAT
jgi:alpha-mannosidase